MLNSKQVTRVQLKIKTSTMSRISPSGWSLLSIYEGISITKLKNLKVKKVNSNLKYTVSKLVKKKTTINVRNAKKATIILVSRRKRHHAKWQHAKSHPQRAVTQRANTQKGITQRCNKQKVITQRAITQRANTQKA